MKYLTSLKRKVTFGYYLGSAIILGLSIFTFIILIYIQVKTISWEVTSELLNATLEIKRFEKNFFLYGDYSAYKENIQYVKKAQDILEKNTERDKILEIHKHLYTMKIGLEKYETLMEQFATLEKKNIVERQVLEKSIRESSKGLISTAEIISQIEKEKLKLLLTNIRILLISIIVMSFGWIVVAHILARMIVRPLKALEEEMRQIAEGKLEKVAINSKDREIVSLTNAFNKMLKELELRQKHLIQTEKLASLGTLVSGVAHELNNPLSNISSSCQILMEEFEDADMEYKKQLLSQIDEQTERARNIVHSLLEFSRHKEFKKETLPLKRLFEETILFVKGEIPAGAKINLDIQEDVFVLADKQRIQQVFLNLIKNALESIADEGSLFIRAKKYIFNRETEEKEICEYPRFRGKCTGTCPAEKDTIDIEIEDTGSGIPPEVLPKIFDPFFTTKDVGKGSGLGLFIVQEIIEEHDGCIGVDSEVGKGTCFLIRLPIRSDDAKKRETINR